MAGGADDLVELFMAIERKGAHAVIVISLRYRALGLHRMHEAQLGIWQELVHQPHFAKRRDVIMRDTGIPKQFEQSRRRIGLYRIKRLTLKLLGEETGSTRRGMRAKERDRFVRAEGADYSQCVRIFVQLKGPPKK
jgi:hypothetical protein